MSVNALAKGLHVSATRMSDIVRGRRGITPDTALRLARFFGGGAQSWLNLQQAYDLKLAEKTLMKNITEEIVPLTETAMCANDIRFSLPS